MSTPTGKVSYLRKFYNKALEKSNSKKTYYTMCLISFLESSIFPLPPDLLMIPMILANKSKAFSIAWWATICSVVGGIVGYGIGYGLLHLSEWIIATYHLNVHLEHFQQQFTKWGFWIIALKGLTPIPFKLVTIASGMAHYAFWPFLLASLIARSFRFYILAFLLWKFGDKAKAFIEKRLTLVFTLIMIGLVLGIVMVKFI